MAISMNSTCPFCIENTNGCNVLKVVFFPNAHLIQNKDTGPSIVKWAPHYRHATQQEASGTSTDGPLHCLIADHRVKEAQACAAFHRSISLREIKSFVSKKQRAAHQFKLSDGSRRSIASLHWNSDLRTLTLSQFCRVYDYCFTTFQRTTQCFKPLEGCYNGQWPYSILYMESIIYKIFLQLSRNRRRAEPWSDVRYQKTISYGSFFLTAKSEGDAAHSQTLPTPHGSALFLKFSYIQLSYSACRVCSVSVKERPWSKGAWIFTFTVHDKTMTIFGLYLTVWTARKIKK